MPQPFGFTEEDAKKVAQASAWVIKNYRLPPPPPTRYPVVPQGAIVKHAVVTTAASAATAGGTGHPSLPSTDGVATLYTYVEDVGYEVYAEGVPIRNDAPSGGIPVNTEIKVILQDGSWFVFWYLC